MFFNLHSKMTLASLLIDNSHLIAQLTFCAFELSSYLIFHWINVMQSDQK